MIYPDQQKMDPKYHKNNIESIKKKQQENRERKEFMENYQPRKFFYNLAEPYKIGKFKNVESKLKSMV